MEAALSSREANPVIQKNWQELIKPKKLEVSYGDDPRRVATVVAEPLERGFGQTLGNSLRRILLSSLQGAAITSIHVDGVLHEFSSIPGVREDVVDIILNVKDIAVKMQGDGVKRLVLKKRGPGTVTAGDIQTSGDIQVLNPSLALCTLDYSRSAGRLTGNPLPQANAYAMIQRRARAAGITTKIGNHTFRATGVTAYLKNGGTLEKAAQMANHASTRTTQLYDRRAEEVTLDEVERVLI